MDHASIGRSAICHLQCGECARFPWLVSLSFMITFWNRCLEGNVKNRILISMMFLVCMDLSAAAALHAQENFYMDKTIRLIVGCTPGGFYDRWGRLFARYMPKYIPGNPEIIVQ